MSNAVRPTIIVGVSGSGASAAALRWAVAEARGRHAQLRVVRSWTPEQHAPYATLKGRPSADQQRTIASRDLAAAMRAMFGPAMPDGVVAELAEGMPERTLVDRSAAADLLVLGASSQPTPAGRSAGPVIRTCLSRAHCPVVVVSADGGPGNDCDPSA